MKTASKPILIATIILTGLISIARADDILGNLPVGNIGNQSAYIGYVTGFPWSMYEGFTMNQSCTLDAFSAIIRDDSYGICTFTAGLYADNGGQPGSLLLSLGDVNFGGFTSSSFSEYTFDTGGSFTLNSGSTYWIGVSGRAIGSGYYGEWGVDSANNNNGTTPTSPGSVATFLQSDFSQGYPVGYSYVTQIPAFEIDATPVPEPSTMSLMAVSLLGLVGINVCRKSKSTQ